MQDILAYITLGLAIGFLVKKYFFKTKKKGKCNTNCDC
ncbi:MAG: FeoB-associated Cys-rich membrane protein [Lutibacter sp.]|nr:FeoB-associated Cys-rich membrane protein [Lutibacter sp.]NNJ58878.1 FeoB-associated Cys-rich membrane protein [Lutibacter sp.]